mmetsp:Transcript_6789/g.21074  ORF Transcript_6789/g.21074 Transcript_6789/m.21074 type:complete len:220 (-) Transcript_6789:4046-4705(-)|eukprot:scaffold201055_cov29-Tisochrysis_lutea.AAC.14
MDGGTHTRSVLVPATPADVLVVAEREIGDKTPAARRTSNARRRVRRSSCGGSPHLLTCSGGEVAQASELSPTDKLSECVPCMVALVCGGGGPCITGGSSAPPTGRAGRHNHPPISRSNAAVNSVRISSEEVGSIRPSRRMQGTTAASSRGSKRKSRRSAGSASRLISEGAGLCGHGGKWIASRWIKRRRKVDEMVSSTSSLRMTSSNQGHGSDTAPSTT